MKDTVKKINKQYFLCIAGKSVRAGAGQSRWRRNWCVLPSHSPRRLQREKRRKNLVDFHDLEHFALRDSRGCKTARAALQEEFRDMYEEIMIDEYQDNNHVR